MPVTDIIYHNGVDIFVIAMDDARVISWLYWNIMSTEVIPRLNPAPGDKAVIDGFIKIKGISIDTDIGMIL